MRSDGVRIKPLIWPFAFLFLIASLCPFTSSGQTDGSDQVISVSGSATAASGVAVGGALVQVISEAGVLVESVTTQKDGSYTLRLAPGTYIVRGLVEGKIIGDEQLILTGAGSPTSRLIEGKFFQGSRDTSTKSGPAIADPKGQIVRIFYATDRQPSPAPATYGRAYSAARNPSGALSYGSALVSIPRDHKMGDLETPTWWSFSVLPNADGYVTLTRVGYEDRGAFFQDVHATVASSATKSAFVFIHGYNVSFEDAARRTAQMAYDLGFDGAPILYSWPSQGKKQEYPADEDSVQWTVEHLRAFLIDVAQKSGAQRVQLIAHSMGNRALVNALDRLAENHSSVKFREVVLAAPDIDADIFRQLSAAISSQSGRVTLYASSADLALIASQQFHKYSRAGESGKNIVILRGIDTIDATRVDTGFLGHSYFADNRSILADVFSLFRYDLPAQSRFGLEPEKWNQMSYWSFKP
jgi:esterase/lipase superfamily enzyme